MSFAFLKSFVYSLLLTAYSPVITFHDDTLPLNVFLSYYSTIITRSLGLSMSLGALVAFVGFLLCVFLRDGTVALSNSLKHTKTFGASCTKGPVWCHVAVAPEGARR